jgi:2-keto-4-pentenoate hydratase
MSDQTTAAAFAAARKSEAPLDCLPEDVPPSFERAFALQGLVTQELGWTQCGWKIGCTSERAQKALNAPGPFPGTMFSNRVFKSGVHYPTIAANKRVVEPEVCFRMKSDLVSRGREYSVDEVVSAVDAVCVAIEVVNPRTPKGFGDAVPWFIVDCGLNDAIILGEWKAPLERGQFAALRGEVTCNGAARQGGIGSNALGGGDIALTWLANHLNSHSNGLKAGDIITTGVITEFFSAAWGDIAEARFEHLGEVSVRF